MSLNPQYVHAWNGKGNALYSLQRYSEALAAFEQALALDSKMKEAWNGKGNALKDLKRHDEFEAP